jgi:uncharacterized protein YcnI
MGLRAALKFGAAAGVLFLVSIAGMAPAAAHVHVVTDTAVRGDTAILASHVPYESETGSPTTGFDIVLANAESASTDVMAGWKSRLERDLTAGVIRSATWTAEKPELRGDNVARALAGSALLVAAIGVGVALVRRGA